MKVSSFLTGVLFLVSSVSCGRNILFESFPDLPDPLGLSGLYSAELDGSLIVAGGCNFPDKPVYDGGLKYFYDKIWRIDPICGKWSEIGNLTCASAYGACFKSDGRLLIAGGANSSGALASCVSIGMDGKEKALPDLPWPVQQAGGCSTGECLYLAGGLSSEPGYSEVLVCHDSVFVRYCTLPEPMVQPLAFHDGKFLYVWGGFNPLEKISLDYGYRFDGKCWTRIPGYAEGETLTGSSGVSFDGKFYVCGGVNKEIMDYALLLSGTDVYEYQKHPREWYGFRDYVRIFDPINQSWTQGPSHPSLAKAGAALVSTSDGSLLNIGGEAMPGVRSVEILKLRLK